MRVIETTRGKRIPYLLSAVVLFGVVVMLLLRISTVFAASTYTVNSIGDDPDDNPGDAVCETATPGECTLRAAITTKPIDRLK